MGIAGFHRFDPDYTPTYTFCDEGRFAGYWLNDAGRPVIFKPGESPDEWPATYAARRRAYDERMAAWQEHGVRHPRAVPKPPLDRPSPPMRVVDVPLFPWWRCDRTGEVLYQRVGWLLGGAGLIYGLILAYGG